MEITGKVIEISEVQSFSPKFSKRDVVLEYADNPMYPQYIKLQAVNDKATAMESIKPGDTIKVQFNLRGNKVEKNGETMYFTNLDIWKFNVIEMATAGPAPQPEEDEDDLPF